MQKSVNKNTKLSDLKEPNVLDRVKFIGYENDVVWQWFEKIANDLMPISGFEKKKYIIDNANRGIIDQMIKYFWLDATCKIDVYKGIILHGNTGTGKTMLFEIFNELIKLDGDNCIMFRSGNKMCKFNLTKINAREMTDNLVKDKTELFENCRTYRSVFIDEIGKEALQVKHYGNIITPIEDIVDSRDKIQGLLFATTNLSLAELNDRYGARVYSRLNKLATFIDVTGTDRRN